MEGLSIWDDTVGLDAFDASEVYRVAALRNTGTGPAAPNLRAEVVVFDDFSGDVTTGVELPDGDCCADVLARGSRDELIVSPERGGRSDAYWMIDLEQGARDEYPLPNTITVTAAIQLDIHLYVAHTTGLTVLSVLGEYRGEIANWDVPAAALSVSFTDGLPTINALDAQNQAIAVIDPVGTRREVGGFVRLTPQLPLSSAPPNADDLAANVTCPATIVFVGRDTGSGGIVGGLTLALFGVGIGLSAWVCLRCWCYHWGRRHRCWGGGDWRTRSS